MYERERLAELGCYGLAGHVDDPRVLLDEVRDAERIGLGSVFLSERFNVKEAATLTGAAAAVSEEVGIATGVTNTPTRHPLVTASWAMTMHKLTRGRFALGIGRGIGPLLDIMGIPKITMAQMEDAVGIYRRLWRGEPVFGHDGPAGRYPLLTLGSGFDEHIPVMAACLGFKTMRWAGRVMDGVILHTFVTDEALARCVAEVRRGAEEAGRDPAAVKVWAVLATLHEPDHERRLRGLTGRMATYFQAYGDALVAMNGWDPAPLEAFRADPVVQSVPGAIDAVATVEQLEHITTLIPETWLPAAVGSADAAPPVSSTSSTPEPTASSSTAPPRPSSSPSWRPTGGSGPSGGSRTDRPTRRAEGVARRPDRALRPGPAGVRPFRLHGAANWCMLGSAGQRQAPTAEGAVMSRRHHDLQPARSARQLAKLEKRKARHKANLALQLADDPEDLVVLDPKPERIPRDEAPPRRNRLRHWKVKAWKRRTAERHRRNEQFDQLRHSA